MHKVTNRHIGTEISAQDIVVNIDTIEIALEGMKFHIPNSTNAVLHDENGEIKSSYENRVPIKRIHSVHDLNVRSINSGKYLIIEGSPFAHRYGQNIFTDNDILRASRLAINKTLKFLDMDVPDELRKKWLAGDATLLRVDLAVNFRLKSEFEVISVLKQIKRQLIEQRGSTRSHGTTFYWAPKNGTQYSIALYAKGPQMRNSKKHKGLAQREELVAECENILRVEVRLRASELRKLGLSKVSEWESRSVETEFMKYFDRLKLLSVTSGPVTDEELDSLPDGMRPVLALHKAGVDLSRVYSRRTGQRHSKFFREKGIDLRCPSQSEDTVVLLKDYLSRENVIREAPEWMKEAGLVPPPSRKRSAMRKSKSSDVSRKKVLRGNVSMKSKSKRRNGNKSASKASGFDFMDLI